MPTLPTFDDVYEIGKAEIQSRNPDLTDFSEGSDLDAVTGGGAMLADEVIRVLIALFAEQFIDTAEGDALDALALDRFGLTRKPASAAVGSVTLERVDSSIPDIVTIAAGTTVSGKVDGVTLSFTTDVEVEIGSADTTVDADATCTTTGRSGNVAPGVIDTVVDPPAEDLGLTVTNAARFAGGAPEETDERFRDRIRRYLATLRRGTVGALETGARSIPGVEYVTVDETFIHPDDGGYVGVYIGDPDARASAVLVALVDAEMINWRAAGIYVVVQAAEREEITLAVQMTVLAGADQTVLRSGIRQAILQHINGIDSAGDISGGLDVGETMSLSRLLTRAMRISDDIVGGAVLSHTEDLDPTQPYYAIRVPSTSLSVTFVEVS